MEFRKYMHVERYGNDEVQGIELGNCYVFPKLDGTNASVWMDSDGNICSGSRNRQLSLESDNAGFCKYVSENEGCYRKLFSGFHDPKSITIYGEWLVPHSLKTYRDDCWRVFYIFDIWDELSQKYIKYDDYLLLMDDDECSFQWVTPLCVMKNASYESLLQELKNNTFLIKDGEGCGEGIVLKNYDFENKFKRVTWAKMITNSFKEKHHSEMGSPTKDLAKLVEQSICDKYVNSHLVEKVYSKIVNEMEGWNSKYIPRLLQTVYYDLVREEMWDIIKTMKNPTINFKTLMGLVVIKVKELMPQLF